VAISKPSMRTFCLVALLALVAYPAWSQPNPEDQPRDKRAQTTMKFLSLSLDARATALGDAVTADDRGYAALFYNPAAMARQENALNLSMSQTKWIADINYSALSATSALGQGRYGVVGLSLIYVDYGIFQGTIRSNNDQGFVDVGSFSPKAYAIGLGYAKTLTDRFAVGGHIQYAAMDFGSVIQSRDRATGGLVLTDVKESTLKYDFGMLYKTGFRSLNFAVSARNFSPEVTYVQESAQLPLTVRIGFGMNLADVLPIDRNIHSLHATVDAVNYRDYDEQVRIGMEYGFMNTFFLRGGTAMPTDEEGFSVGAGIQRSIRGFGGFGADYAYTDMGIFNQFSRVHRITLRFSL